MESYFKAINRIQEIKTSFRKLNRPYAAPSNPASQTNQSETSQSSLVGSQSGKVNSELSFKHLFSNSNSALGRSEKLDGSLKNSVLEKGKEHRLKSRRPTELAVEEREFLSLLGQPKKDQSYTTLIEPIAKKYDLPSSLIHSVIKAESNFNPDAVSTKGAMGLMQLMPQTAEELGVKDPFNPRENIEGGTQYLKGLLTQYQGNLLKALAAYNAGPEVVSARDSVPGFPETQDYVKKVIKNYLKSNGVVNP